MNQDENETNSIFNYEPLPTTGDIESVSNYITDIISLPIKYSVKKIKQKCPTLTEGLRLEREGIKKIGFWRNLIDNGGNNVLPRLTIEAIEKSAINEQNNSINIKYLHGDLMANMPQELFKEGYISYKEVTEAEYNPRQLNIDIDKLNIAYNVPSRINFNIASNSKDKNTLVDKISTWLDLKAEETSLSFEDFKRKQQGKIESLDNFLVNHGE